MAERTVKANGIEIWTEGFGEPADPTILLIMGASAQGILWPEEIYGPIVAAGRHVIRYDNRDTGQTSCFDFAEHPYTLSDLARDAVGVLDAYGIERAHAVGASMGGMIGQTIAIEQPERLITLTSIMSSPGGAAVAEAMSSEEASDDELPPPTQEVMDLVMSQVSDPPKTREEKIERRAAMFRLLAGSLGTYDEAAARERFEREYDRARNWEAQNNHGLAIANSPDRRPALARVTVPTLVIHGTEDPILPYEHGTATAKAIPGAELLTIEGMGHGFPEPALPRILDAIVRHTARAG